VIATSSGDEIYDYEYSRMISVVYEFLNGTLMKVGVIYGML